MTTERSSISCSKATQQRLQKISNITGKSQRELIDIFIDAMSASENSLKVLSDVTNKLPLLEEYLVKSVEEYTAIALDKHRRRIAAQEAYEKLAAEPKIPTISQLIKDNIAFCDHWGKLEKIIKRYHPGYICKPVTSPEIAMQRYYYPSQVISNMFRNKYLVDTRTGSINKL